MCVDTLAIGCCAYVYPISHWLVQLWLPILLRHVKFDGGKLYGEFGKLELTYQMPLQICFVNVCSSKALLCSLISWLARTLLSHLIMVNVCDKSNIHAVLFCSLKIDQLVMMQCNYMCSHMKSYIITNSHMINILLFVFRYFRFRQAHI